MSTKLVIFISGNGTNLQAIIEAVREKRLPATIEAVFSNKHDAYGVTRAKYANIYTVVQEKQKGQTREEYDSTLLHTLQSNFDFDLIILAGWMRVLTKTFLDQVGVPVINLHPALPGQFDGTHAIERAYQAYQEGKIKHSGLMIHEVIPKIDAGRVIVQQKVEIYSDDTLEVFDARMRYYEKPLLLQGIEKYIRETLQAPLKLTRMQLSIERPVRVGKVRNVHDL